MNSDAPIFLIGYRGTGKTSVARELSGRLGYDCLDADDEVERQAGQTIAAIFAESGEAGFRELESQVVAKLCKRRQAVVALGGGAVLLEQNRRAIAASGGTVVWLTASIATIQSRLAGDPVTGDRRPNLTAAGGRHEIETLLAQRAPLYRQCATLEIDTEGKTPAAIADEIATHLSPP